MVLNKKISQSLFTVFTDIYSHGKDEKKKKKKKEKENAACLIQLMYLFSLNIHSPQYLNAKVQHGKKKKTSTNSCYLKGVGFVSSYHYIIFAYSPSTFVIHVFPWENS